MFWLCAENCEDNIEKFLLLLSKVAQSQDLFCFSHYRTGKGAGGPWEMWEEKQPG